MGCVFQNINLRKRLIDVQGKHGASPGVLYKIKISLIHMKKYEEGLSDIMRDITESEPRYEDS